MNLTKKTRFFSLSFMILFSLWVILSGTTELFFIFCGVFSSTFTLLIFKRLIDSESAFNAILNSRNSLLFYKLLSIYIPWLMYQVTLSNIYITKKVLQKKLILNPITILKKCKGHNKKSIALFANSVTITPGTLTICVASERRDYISTIYLIDKSLKRGITKMEEMILKIIHKQRS